MSDGSRDKTEGHSWYLSENSSEVYDYDELAYTTDTILPGEHEHVEENDDEYGDGEDDLFDLVDKLLGVRMHCTASTSSLKRRKNI